MSTIDLYSWAESLSELSLPIQGAILFSILILLLLIYITVHQYNVNRREAKRTRWNFIADHAIRSAIFFDDEEPKDPLTDALSILEADKLKLPGRLMKLMHNPYFRSILAKKIVSAKRNMSGEASENLVRLFRQLQLDQRALEMLNGSLWSRKALAIQQIGGMGLVEFEKNMLKYVDDKHGLIRVEAQNALLRFHGFDGLRFLDTATYPITEWQQIKLLDQLSHLKAENFTGIDFWLKSNNESVVLFALKLVKTYHRYELYQEVISCLKHQSADIRMQAIIVLKKLLSENTAPVLIALYPDETLRNKLAILQTLEVTSTTEDIPFLMNILDDQSNEIKMGACRALVSLGEEGKDALCSHPQADSRPLCQMIAQIKEETR